ncbi:neuropeptide F-like isoform X3 [Stegodyphus dumicola]|uniref:neuropeptide F-like isoform X3 n=1 Tax=Stegodyphus dumicola TaxID=202533 RepID=UPI0015ADC70A|nr:neuropeptide F-like isoform X3 [Stegodyphus dumicola]
MMSKLGIFLFAFSMVVALLVVSLPAGTRASPNIDEAANMAEALRYLEQIDKYYSQMARPRYGRSVGLHKKSQVTLRSKKPSGDRERR